MESELDKYFTNGLTESEKRTFLKKVESDPVLLDEFISTQNAIGLSSMSSFADDKVSGENSLKQFEARVKTTKRKKSLRVALQYAAMITLAIVGTWFVTKEYYWNSLSPLYTEIVVPQGHRAQVLLDDGTKVWLNSRSKLRYPSAFSGKERTVTLDGDALFDVAENVDRPFVVKTSRYDVKVLGTIFNVFNFSESPVFETTLLEGKVKVSKAGEEKCGIVLNPNEKVFLRNGSLEKVGLREQNLNQWQNGIVAFNNVLFEDIILKLELYYNVRFIIHNENALKNSYTGSFNVTDPIETILGAIQQVQKFKYSMSSDNKIVYIN